MNPANKRRETMQAVLIALLAALILRQFVVAAYKIPTPSMEDTLLVGDFLLVNKFVYGAQTPDWIGLPFTRNKDWIIPTGFEMPDILRVRLPAVSEPKSQDILVFKYPLRPEIDYIKRCIARGGQTVEARDKEIYVDGERLADPPYLKFEADSLHYGTHYRGFHPLEVSEGNYFVMGDNRDNSSDSRDWGMVPEENIIGKPLIIYFSLSDSLAQKNMLERLRWDRLGTVVR